MTLVDLQNLLNLLTFNYKENKTFLSPYTTMLIKLEDLFWLTRYRTMTCLMDNLLNTLLLMEAFLMSLKKDLIRQPLDSPMLSILTPLNKEKLDHLLFRLETGHKEYTTLNLSAEIILTFIKRHKLFILVEWLEHWLLEMFWEINSTWMFMHLIMMEEEYFCINLLLINEQILDLKKKI
jgi:hypothetical protein